MHVIIQSFPDPRHMQIGSALFTFLTDSTTTQVLGVMNYETSSPYYLINLRLFFHQITQTINNN